jgi:hypothetical protein
VYDAGDAASVESWLTANQLAPADGSTMPAFQTANVSGVQVCSSTMIAPGCQFYVLGDGWVYQLTAATQTGEAMIQTFKLL